jgi:hypothetical protein
MPGMDTPSLGPSGETTLGMTDRPGLFSIAPPRIAAPAVGQAVGNVTASLTLLTATWYECSMAR